MKKKFPDLKSDKKAEQFVEESDLSEYDFSNFQPTQFEFQPKDKQINLRMSTPLWTAIREKADQEGMPYQRYIRQIIEAALQGETRV